VELAPQQPQVLILDSFTALRNLPWPQSVDHGATDIFFTCDWFENLASTGFDADARLHLLVVEIDGSPCACLPMADNVRSENTSPTTLTSLSNFYSCLFGPIGSCGSKASETWNLACRKLKAAKPQWPVINLRPLDTDSHFFSAMKTGLKNAGYWTDSYFCFGNWYLDVAGRTFEQYLKSLSSKLRSNISRARKKLDASGPWDIVIHVAPGAELDEAVASFERVYALSWKQAEPYPKFIQGLCRTAAANGSLRLGVLRYNGEAIAAQLWLVIGGRALIYKIAYDHAQAALSGGAVLTAEMIRHAIDIDKVQEVDYLSGDDAYKRHWMSHRRERFGIVAFNPGTITGFLAASRHFLGRLVRRVITTLRQRFPRKNNAPE